jgi:LPXTG-motif cell wall-anchored protein
MLGVSWQPDDPRIRNARAEAVVVRGMSSTVFSIAVALAVFLAGTALLRRRKRRAVAVARLMSGRASRS